METNCDDNPLRRLDELECQSSQHQVAVQDALQSVPITVVLGRGILGLVDPKQGAHLVNRIPAIRLHVAKELGFEMPAVRFRDDIALEPGTYTILICGVEVARVQLQPDRFMAIAPEEKLQSIPGDPCNDPIWGMPGKWIEAKQRSACNNSQIMLLDPISVVAAHLTEIVCNFASDLLGFESSCNLLNQDPTRLLFSQLELQGVNSLKVWKVLRLLLAERVSIHARPTILAALADHLQETTNPEALTEFVRRALARQLCSQVANSQREIKVLLLDPQIEVHLASNQELDTNSKLRILEAVASNLETFGKESQPVLLVPDQARRPFRKQFSHALPTLKVMSLSEIAPGYYVESLAMISA